MSNSNCKTEKFDTIEPEVFFNLTYGIYLVTAKDDTRDNGCIVNTVTQVTDSPKRISVTINKMSLTHDIIRKTGVLNVSILSENAELSVIERFGFSSGRNINKFENFPDTMRSTNNLLYLAKFSNAMMSGEVIESLDFDTHTVFFAEVKSAKILTKTPAMTYRYYLENIKV